MSQDQPGPLRLYEVTVYCSLLALEVKVLIRARTASEAKVQAVASENNRCKGPHGSVDCREVR